ncbi:MAG TPA: DNA adenine methylase [Anaerolineae bacterium]|nr:DNA adenine methylase [Anaerolineae bacterium]
MPTSSAQTTTSHSPQSPPKKPKPFLKWVGGKRQLIPQIETLLPPKLKNGSIKRFVEPFVGGGALFFHLNQTTNIHQFILCDRNQDIILTYQIVKENVHQLIDFLADIQQNYYQLNEQQRKNFFYETRRQFNQTKQTITALTTNKTTTLNTARLIFLNRTCFNGLYRVNAKGGFNVPFGRYKKPKICDQDNLLAVSRALASAKILHGDYTLCQDFIGKQTFVYFDPPYRPLNKTSNFNTYAKKGFDDNEQIRLATFFRNMAKTNAKLMLSNSDPHNINPDDNFFQTLYAGFNIYKLSANRMINSNSKKRGKLSELLITNY